MALIGQIIRDVAALLLLAALAELLLPSGALSRFIRLAIGLMLVAAVITPLLERMGGDFPPPEFGFAEPALAEQYIAEGEDLAAAFEQQAQREYAAELERQIIAIALLAEGVEQAAARVELTAEGRIESVQLGLVLAPGAGAAAEQRALKLAQGFFPAESWQVESRMEEAEQ